MYIFNYCIITIQIHVYLICVYNLCVCEEAVLYSSFPILRSRGIATNDLGICLRDGSSASSPDRPSFACLLGITSETGASQCCVRV